MNGLGLSETLWLIGAHVSRLDQDGPALLLPEISALLRYLRVWVPFRASRALADPRWLGTGEAICGDGFDGLQPDTIGTCPDGIDAVYFGVPTIVDGRALFDAPNWQRDNARSIARSITRTAIEHGAKLIVTGLGSGDITPEMRLADIGGGKIIAYKDFGSFQDWVIARWLPP
jgi:hypothetical protein